MSSTRLTIDALVALLFGTLTAARTGTSAELVARLGAGAGRARRVRAKSDRLLLRSLIDGVSKPGAALGMPPKGGNPALTDADMRAGLVFLRREFDTHPRQPAGEP